MRRLSTLSTCPSPAHGWDPGLTREQLEWAEEEGSCRAAPHPPLHTHAHTLLHTNSLPFPLFLFIVPATPIPLPLLYFSSSPSPFIFHLKLYLSGSFSIFVLPFSSLLFLSSLLLPGVYFPSMGTSLHSPPL